MLQKVEIVREYDVVRINGYVDSFHVLQIALYKEGTAVSSAMMCNGNGFSLNLSRNIVEVQNRCFEMLDSFNKKEVEVGELSLKNGSGGTLNRYPCCNASPIREKRKDVPIIILAKDCIPCTEDEFENNSQDCAFARAVNRVLSNELDCTVSFDYAYVYKDKEFKGCYKLCQRFGYEEYLQVQQSQTDLELTLSNVPEEYLKN